MYNIAIGIPTYKRPGMLKKLVQSIAANEDTALVNRVSIVVVDNDPERSAETVTDELIAKIKGNHRLYYYNFPTRGLSNMRNEIFNRALLHDPDFILCIDDDEYPTPFWLHEMVTAMLINKADIVLGPVIPEMEKQVPKSLSYHFTYHKIANNKEIRFLETNNYAIRTEFLLKHELKFDSRFNFTGAEDSYFGIEAMKKGGKICWAADAVVYETISRQRASLQWLVMRNYRGAITYTYVLLLEKKYALVLKKLLISIFYLLTGIVSLILMPFQSKYRFWGIIKIAAAAGGFAGLLNVKFYEYQNDLKSSSGKQVPTCNSSL